MAGLPRAISSVPDGMAEAVLAGVNPVQGRYAGFAGPVAGGLTSHTRLMVITTTSAAALAAGSALQGVPPAQRPAAVGIGVALSLLLQLNQEAMDLAVVELVPRDDGLFEERKPAAVLASRQVIILDVYGSLMYAGSRTLQAHLPDPGGAGSPVVILRLRRRTSLGATFVKVVGDYADRLAEAGGRLYLTGPDPSLTERLRGTGHLDGPVRAFEATPVVGASTRAASLDAETWLVTRHHGGG